MCRSGDETPGTEPRRCECSDTQRQAHNATRMMTQTARRIATASDNALEGLKATFMRHCNKLRTLKGMGDGEYPLIPETVSKVSTYTKDKLDSMPYEHLDEACNKAAEEGDWATAERLSMAIEEREHQGSIDPIGLEDDERRRWQDLQRTLSRNDPALAPYNRAGGVMSKAEAEKALRIEYEAHIEREIMAAEEATNGQLFTPRGRSKAMSNPNITPRAMWNNHILANHYASDELREFWQQRGHERITFEAFRETYRGQSGPAREAVAKSSLLAA